MNQRFIVIATAALATTLRMTGANPGLAAKWPQQAGSFVFDHGLIVTTTDGLHWRIATDTPSPIEAGELAMVRVFTPCGRREPDSAASMPPQDGPSTWKPLR